MTDTPIPRETIEQLISQVAAADAKLTFIMQRVSRLDSLGEDVAGLRRDMLRLLGNGHGGEIAELWGRLRDYERRQAAEHHQLHARISNLELGASVESAASRARWKAALLYGGIGSGILDALLHLGQLIRLWR